MWFVYVIQSQIPRTNHKGDTLPGYTYVGCTKDPIRRIRQHNGEIYGGGKYTENFRPWIFVALYGTYENRSEAQKAEYALKKLRGEKRLNWQGNLRRGLGKNHPFVKYGRSWSIHDLRDFEEKRKEGR
jgi:predicted GIY-YIG superfamily endonuclease